MTLTWILERDVFPDNHDRLALAIEQYGHKVVTWNDDWWETGKISSYKGERSLFHGSLGNASRIKKHSGWLPGAFCNTEAFKCTSWYSHAEPWLVNTKWALSTVQELVEDPIYTLKKAGADNQFFVRPNSPLKPFSGRVLNLENLSLQALDHGFYYDDSSLEIIVAPVQKIQDEWRYVVVGQKVVAGSGYTAEQRVEISASPEGEQWQYAQKIANNINSPDDVYVIDICLVENNLKLLELNPFSGADLYACNRAEIVKAISNLSQG